MISQNKKELIQFINSQKQLINFIVSGGSSSFIGEFLSLSGGSSTIYSFEVPYDNRAFIDKVGPIEQFCSWEAARKLAFAAKKPGILGVGVTCSLVKDNERSGREHKIFAAICDEENNSIYCWKAVIKHGNNREREEEIAKDFLYNCLWEFYSGFIGLSECRHPGIERYDYFSEWLDLQGVFQSVVCRKYFIKDGEISSFFTNINFELENNTLIIYPGSFHPISSAHKEIYETVIKDFNIFPLLEVSRCNVDKVAVTEEEAQARVDKGKQFDYIVANCAKFSDKIITYSKFFGKQIWFITGIDTICRVFNRKYYNSDNEFIDFLEQLKKTKTYFIVFQRGGGKLEDIILPDGYYIKTFICRYYENYYNPISSTLLRSQNQ